MRVWGRNLPSVPSKSKFSCKSFIIDGIVVVEDADVDLRGAGVVEFADNTHVITRNGRRVALASLRANSVHLDGMLAVTDEMNLSGKLGMKGGSVLRLPADPGKASAKSISTVGDGAVTLAELHRYLSIAVPSSSSQLLSTRASGLSLPVAQGAMLSRPLMGFSYGTSLLSSEDPVLDFSFTVTRENTAVQYRLVDFTDGSWDWKNARTFLDEGDNGDALLAAGRKMRSLSLEGITPDEGGYLMLQVFSVSGSEVLLCSERLIAVQSALSDATITLTCRSELSSPGLEELPIDIRLDAPAELTVSIYDAEGTLIRRLAASQLTRPSPDNVTHLYWDGRSADGEPVSSGLYTIAAEARIGAKRSKATAEIAVGSF